MDSKKISIPIVLACDETYAMPLATTLRSIVENNRKKWPLNIHILSDGFSEQTKSKILNSLYEGSVSLNWVQVDSGLFSGFSTLEHVSKMTYARLLTPRLFPKTANKVLYLDADILVLDDLSPLLETDLEGAVVGAVLDCFDSLLKEGKTTTGKFPTVRDYFNAGVLLIDLDQWRKEQISEKGLNYLYKNPLSPFSDQDALNFACDGMWKKLDSHWNFQKHLGVKISDMSAAHRPGIVHFVTEAKPWNARIPNLNASFYDSFRSRTCFARTPVNVLWDHILRFWFFLKGYLRKYSLLRNMWRHIKPWVQR